MNRGRKSNAGAEATWKQQAVHVHKAITEKEIPPKKKHVRAIILATFDEYSSKFFYEIALKLPVFSNPVVCWKLLYIIHKLIREGHPECILDCLRYASKIALVKSAWDSCTNTYGYPLENYFKFIAVRLKLHRKYGNIPGNLELQPRDVSTALNAPPDSLFTFSVDLMDLLEEILTFQEAILNSFGGVHSVSFSQIGQCKLAPVLLCVQDAAALYELIIHVMFKLHEVLENSMLLGHRQRFASLHQSLSKFFDLVCRMQQLKSFVEIPTLSQNPPNFCIQSELNEHQALRVTVHETENSASGDEAISLASDGRPIERTESSQPLHAAIGPPKDDLLFVINDNPTQTSPTSNKSALFLTGEGDQRNNHALSPVPLRVTDETHEFLIEVELLKSEIERIKRENQNHSNALLERIRTLEDEIKDVVQEKSMQEEQREELEARLREKVNEAETADVKFNKLKDIYTKLREEHVTALRSMTVMQQNCEAEKHKNEELRKQIETLSGQVAHMEHTRAVLEEAQLGASNSLNELNVTKTRLMDLERSNADLDSSVRSLTQSKSQLKEKLSSTEQRVLLMEEEKLHANESLRAHEARLAELTNALETARERCRRLEAQSVELPKAAAANVCKGLLTSTCRRATAQLQQLLQRFSDTELFMMLKTSPDFVLACAQDTRCILDRLETFVKDGNFVDKETVEFPLVISDMSTRFREMLFQCKVLQQFAPDFLELPDPIHLCEEVISFLQHLEADRSEALAENNLAALRQSVDHLMLSVGNFQRLQDTNAVSDERKIAELLEQEMQATVAAIRAAEEKFQEFRSRSAKSLTGDQLRVNEQILDYCSALMAAVGRLVEAANVIQKDLAHTTNVTEFYKQHSRWTQGFLSAAKSVGACANVLVEVADTVAGGDGSALGRMIVVAQEVAVSTTHLFVASRIKAAPGSPNLITLQIASREVSKSTGVLVASVKAAIDTKEMEDLDFSCLTLTQAKRMEVESQVRVLQLESDLVNERRRLAQLRRENYQDAAEVEFVQKKPT